MKNELLSLKKHILLFAITAVTVFPTNAQVNEWSWMSGDTAINIIGVYGTKGTAAASNKPAGRGAASS